ncbi:hypothetical protein Goklo_028367 [Gossypium klotzschianum]|uniref:Uncharacterized protein n=1 Tax=Gossypium klotzschianum TaxID=34286 RepID=A0A7J8U110_9ROSI|nr:hypothetical protein [Gossypium klotzschianum]
MIDLHNVGTFNADTRFKASYLLELERMMEKVLPHVMLNVKPNLESRFRTLKNGQSFTIHKEAAQFRTRSFPYYEQLTSIYVKDRTTGKYAQIAANIFKELCAEDVTNKRNPKEGSNDNEYEDDASLDEMDVLATQS